jgi:hypothetical protein
LRIAELDFSVSSMGAQAVYLTGKRACAEDAIGWRKDGLCDMRPDVTPRTGRAFIPPRSFVLAGQGRFDGSIT